MTAVDERDIDPLSIAALRQARERAESLVIFARGVTYILGLAPLFYGSLTFIYGDDLWGGLPVYGTANKVPLAPQSWGTVAILAGAVLIIATLVRNREAICAAAGVMSLWASFFAMGFVIDAWTSHRPTGYAGAVFYLAISAIYMHRVRLAWVWRDR